MPEQKKENRGFESIPENGKSLSLCALCMCHIVTLGTLQ